MKMKKVAGVIAVAVFALGMFSCQPESSIEETEALYELPDTNANEKDQSNGNAGSGGN